MTAPVIDTDKLTDAIAILLTLVPRNDAFTAITFWLRDLNESDAKDLIAAIARECLV